MKIPKVIGAQWVRSGILAAATAVAAPGVLYAQAEAPAPPVMTAPSTQKELPTPAEILGDRSATQQQREEAARRLVSRSSSEADGVLIGVLTDMGNKEGQLAVARALASDPTPSPSFIDHLANAMGNDRELTSAAAQALAAYRNSLRARQKLIGFANNPRPPLPSRVAAIRAMGRLVEKSAANSLIDLLNRPDEHQQIKEAATGALIEMTGLSRHGNDVQRWINWWKQNERMAEVDWVSDLLNKNAARADENWRRLQRLREHNTKAMRARFDEASADRPALLADWLKSVSEDVRVAAVQIIYEEVAVGKPLPAEILKLLRGMVGDSTVEVRVMVARTLGALNDKEAVDALLTQLRQEQDPDVVAVILVALGPTRDLRAVDPLLQRLSDPSFIVVKSAADALRDMSPSLRNDANAAIADRVGESLRQRLAKTDPRSAPEAPIRRSLVEAMARLGHPGSLQSFYELTKAEDPDVRSAALRGLGQIGNPAAANAILGVLQKETVSKVRLEAVNALRTTASAANVDTLLARLPESVESEPAVRDAIWKLLAGDPEAAGDEGLFGQAGEGELNRWIIIFKGNSPVDRERRLAVLKVLEKKLAADGEGNDLAAVRQHMGDTLLDLDRPAEAAEKIRPAYDYFVKARQPDSVLNVPRNQLTKAMLRARQWEQAVGFVTGVIEVNKQAEDFFLVEILSEADRLRKAREWETGVAMMEAAKKIPFGKSTVTRLEKLRQDFDASRSGGGSIWVRQDFFLTDHLRHLAPPV